MIERFQDREMTPDEKDVVEKVEKFGWMVVPSTQHSAKRSNWQLASGD